MSLKLVGTGLLAAVLLAGASLKADAKDMTGKDMTRDAQLLVGMFGAVCSQAMADPRAVRRLTRDFDAERLPREKVSEIFGSRGQGWSVTAPFGQLSIAIIYPPRCVVVSENIDAAAVQTGFRNYVNTLSDADGKSMSVTDGKAVINGRDMEQLSVKVLNTPTPYLMELSVQQGTSYTRLDAMPLN